MKDFSKNIYNYLKKNKFINKYHDGLIVKGKNPWEINLESNWKDIGRIQISSFELSDFWALTDWWNNSLSYKDRTFYTPFPSGGKLDKAIANHFKKHKNQSNIAFNAWLIKDKLPMEYLFNEIIGHFFLLDIDSKKPYVGIGLSREFQGKKLGTLFMSILIYTMKILNRKTLWLTVDKNNIAGHNLYKKIGFKDLGEIESHNFAQGFESITKEYSMKMDLDNFK